MKIFILLFKYLNLVYLKLKITSLKSKATFGGTVKFFQSSNIENLQNDKSKIIIGTNTAIRGELLIFAHGGQISIGDYCFIGENSKIWSSEEIKIGNRVLISHNVNIHDNNSHPTDSKMRANQVKEIFSSNHPKTIASINSKEIEISDDVWIGFNSTILKGVKIGKGAIIGANSFITKNVEEFTMVIGNPAKEIKKVT